MSFNGNVLGMHLYGALFVSMVFIRCLERDNHSAMAVILLAVGLAHMSYQSDISDSIWGVPQRSLLGVFMSFCSVILSIAAAVLVVIGA